MKIPIVYKDAYPKEKGKKRTHYIGIFGNAYFPDKKYIFIGFEKVQIIIVVIFVLWLLAMVIGAMTG